MSSNGNASDVQYKGHGFKPWSEWLQSLQQEMHTFISRGEFASYFQKKKGLKLATRESVTVLIGLYSNRMPR